jgi:hypothetical protein
MLQISFDVTNTTIHAITQQVMFGLKLQFQVDVIRLGVSHRPIHQFICSFHEEFSGSHESIASCEYGLHSRLIYLRCFDHARSVGLGYGTVVEESHVAIKVKEGFGVRCVTVIVGAASAVDQISVIVS